MVFLHVKKVSLSISCIWLSVGSTHEILAVFKKSDLLICTLRGMPEI